MFNRRQKANLTPAMSHPDYIKEAIKKAKRKNYLEERELRNKKRRRQQSKAANQSRKKNR